MSALNVSLRDVSLSAGSFPRTTCCRPCCRSSTTCRPRAPWSTRMPPMPWRGCSPCEAPTTARCEDHQLEMLILQKGFFYKHKMFVNVFGVLENLKRTTIVCSKLQFQLLSGSTNPSFHPCCQFALQHYFCRDGSLHRTAAHQFVQGADSSWFIGK